MVGRMGFEPIYPSADNAITTPSSLTPVIIFKPIIITFLEAMEGLEPPAFRL